MGVGLEIYDEKGRLVIGTDQIIPRYLGYYEIPVAKNGSLTIPEIEYGGEILCEFYLRYRFKGGGGIWLIAKPNELSNWSVAGATLTWFIDYNVNQWDSGGGQGFEGFSQHLIVWAV